MSSREGFHYYELRDGQNEVIGVQRIYGGKDCIELGIAPFIEWYFIEPDERGTQHEITCEQYDTLMAIHEDSPKYLW